MRVLSTQLIGELQDILGPRLRLGEPMARHTSFRVGGPADAFAVPDTERKVRLVLAAAAAYRAPLWIIGNGTNLLVLDDGVRGIVLQISRNLSSVIYKGEVLQAQAGISLPRLAAEALKHGLTGLEFAAGIPGTLGGGVAMNAGAFGGEMAQVVVQANCADRRGRPITLFNSQLGFAYRESLIRRRGYVVLGAELRLRSADPAQIKSLMEAFGERRRRTQPVDQPSAGSVFKRPPGQCGAALIDKAGLKGRRVGGAMVSPKHAGFIVNLGNATAEDILSLMRIVQDEVRQRFGVWLEPEIEIIGESSAWRPNLLARPTK